MASQPKVLCQRVALPLDVCYMHAAKSFLAYIHSPDTPSVRGWAVAWQLLP